MRCGEARASTLGSWHGPGSPSQFADSCVANLPGTAVPAETKPETQGGGELAKNVSRGHVEPDLPPIWRCSVCGYLASRHTDQEGFLLQPQRPLSMTVSVPASQCQVGRHFLWAKPQAHVMPTSSEPRLWRLAPQHLLGGGGPRESFPGSRHSLCSQESWCLGSSPKSLDILRAEQHRAGHCTSLGLGSVTCKLGS